MDENTNQHRRPYGSGSLYLCINQGEAVFFGSNSTLTAFLTENPLIRTTGARRTSS
jgi:hypothetical protein